MLVESSYEWICSFKDQWMEWELCQHYAPILRAQNKKDKIVLLAKNTIFMEPGGVFYHNEYTYLFEKNITELRQACMILELHR